MRETQKRRTYYSWRDMHRRCKKSTDRDFYRYGARGISVCEEWNSFENFLNDMCYRPEGRISIDRIDNSLNYSKQNCKWSTPAEQQRNTSNTRFIEFNGTRLCVTDWAIKIGIKPNTLTRRLLNGWSIERALCEEVK